MSVATVPVSTSRRTSAAYRPPSAISSSCDPVSTIRAVVHHHDQIGVPDGGEPVRDGQGGPAVGQFGECRGDGRLGPGVQRTGRLVEHQHRRVPQDHPGDRQPLLLATGEPVAALADDGLIALRQGRDQLVDLRGLGGGNDLLVGGIRAGRTAGCPRSTRAAGRPPGRRCRPPTPGPADRGRGCRPRPAGPNRLSGRTAGRPGSPAWSYRSRWIRPPRRGCRRPPSGRCSFSVVVSEPG